MQQNTSEVWTHVPSKSNRKTKPAASTAHSANPASRDLSLSKLTAEFNTKLKTWRQSTSRKTLLQLFTRIRPEVGWQLSKAVCLGSGSLSRENLECRRRSFWQLVVFYDIAMYLLGEGEGKMYAQEPAFTPLDQEFLDSLGVKTLDVIPGDKGLGATSQHLGENTFVFEPFIDMNAGMLEDLLGEGVGLYIGSSIRGILERRGQSQVQTLAKEFHDGHQMLKFPAFEIDPNVMDGMGIYWKEEGYEDEDES